MNEEALAYRQSDGQATRGFLETLRAKHEAVIGAAPSDDKINVQLRTMVERCKTTVDSLNTQMRGLVLKHLTDRVEFGCGAGVSGYCDPPDEGFTDWNFMVKKICEIARHHSVDKIGAASAKAKRAEARAATGADAAGGGASGGGARTKRVRMCHEFDRTGEFTEGDGCEMPPMLPKDGEFKQQCIYYYHNRTCAKKNKPGGCPYGHNFTVDRPAGGKPSHKAAVASGDRKPVAKVAKKKKTKKEVVDDDDDDDGMSAVSDVTEMSAAVAEQVLAVVAAKNAEFKADLLKSMQETIKLTISDECSDQ